ncbi:hypothetical protein PQJ75_08260 [Rhodoplanes sp. TEM]|uniref:Oligosaccharide repeat unit polymerase n=1 Tax=Rhodoplanes tepidamans TaxID=200616 RepID=A0ABT5JAY6_RHOTP|nr:MULTISPECIES: hypothetical protein [Rhodoplanes]MDC7786713.1 hypothetical protein [Rhodoplanes tepidamans]MDC7983719.1 hypothetical protein [Rhodoplanes sp. TEM]MDQ0358149.1 hypothetical protein [Rhodoplanes tepidamans]
MYDLHLLFTLAVWAALCLLFVNSRCASIFHPIAYYLAFHGLVFVVRPFFQHYLELNSVYALYRFWPDPEVKHVTLLIANLGLASFFLGAMWTGNLPMRFPTAEQQDAQDRRGPLLIVTLLLVSPLILMSMRYALSINFGEYDLRNMVRDASTFRTLYTDTSAYIADANLMLGALGVAIAWAYRFRPVALLPFVAFVALRLTIGWMRHSFVLMTIALALLFLFDRRRRWPAPWMVAVGLAGAVMFSALSEHRSLVAEWITGEVTRARVVTERAHFFDGLDFANLEFVEYIVTIVPGQTKTFNYFSNSLEVLTAPIPRALWPEKPTGSPISFYNINNYGYPIGITFTVVGEGWQSLGYAGVVVWCLLGGLLWGGAYRLFVANVTSTFATLYYLLVLPVSLMWFRDGVLITLVQFPLSFVAPILLCQLLGRVVRPRTGAAAPVLRSPR